MTFSKKVGEQTNPQSNGASGMDSDAKKAWNEYQFSCFKAKEKEVKGGKLRKEKQLIGVVNFIMDLGTPPSADSEWDTKCALPVGDEEYSQEELEWKEKNPSHDFIWTNEWDDNAKGTVRVRKQTSPSYPAQEFGVAVDFPQILIDYSKHPNSQTDKEDIRPLRISLNGNFHHKFNKPIVFDGSYKPVSENNLIYKICSAAGKDKELVESKFDIGVAAEAVCNFTVRLDLTEDGGLFPTANKPSPVEDIDVAGVELSAEQQIESVMKDAPLSPFVGILLNDQEYTDSMLGMLGNDAYGYVKRASMSKTFNISGISKAGNAYSFDKGVDYQGSDFQKAYDKFKGTSSTDNTSQNTPVEGKPEKVSNPTPKKETPPQTSSTDSGMGDEGLDFSDEVPF